MYRAAGKGKRIIHNLLKHITGVHALPLARTSNLLLAQLSLQARLHWRCSRISMRKGIAGAASQAEKTRGSA